MNNPLATAASVGRLQGLAPTGQPPVTASASAPGGTSATTSGNAAAITADFETFLRMLTTQLRNQDPLNPVEGADFAVQLATFSSVEQQVQTNDLLTGLGERLDLFGAGQLSGWIGMQARGAGPVVFDGTPLALDLPVAPGADAAQLVAVDTQGREVQRKELPATAGAVTWDGIGADGKPLPPGTYALRTESFLQGRQIDSRPVEWQGRVTEVRIEDGAPVVILETGQRLRAADVLALTEPLADTANANPG